MSLTAKPAWICSHSMNGRAGLLTIDAPSCCVIRGVKASLVRRPDPSTRGALTSNLTIECAQFAGEHSRLVAQRLPICSAPEECGAFRGLGVTPQRGLSSGDLVSGRGWDEVWQGQQSPMYKNILSFVALPKGNMTSG